MNGNLLPQVLFSTAFIGSALYLPWWVTVVIGIMLLSWFGAWGMFIAGGALMDLAFGSPAFSVAGIPFLYTGIFMTLSIAYIYLSRYVLD